MKAIQPVKAVWVSPMRKVNGNQKVLVDPSGVRLHYKKKDALKKYYCCSKKDSLQCPVRVSLDINSDMIVSIKGNHNHDSNVVETTVKNIVKDFMEPAVANPSVGGRAVMRDISNVVLNSDVGAVGLSYMPCPKTISATLSRKRKIEKNFPAIPHSWEEMIIPDIFKKTSDGQDFCIMEEKVPNGVIWGFASNTAMEVMSNTSNWFIDGTFDMVTNTLFKQI